VIFPETSVAFFNHAFGVASFLNSREPSETCQVAEHCCV
jgi:hypothetical protein